MNDTKNEPAMPNKAGCTSWQCRKPSSGLTKGEYAAIHLCQPISGTPWLDEAIAKARRERLAGQALAAMLIDPNCIAPTKSLIESSLSIADSIISALEGGEA